MDDERSYSVVRSVRISAEHQRKIAEAGTNLSDFIRQKIDEEFPEEQIIEQRIQYHERELSKWREREEKHKDKVECLGHLTDAEIDFLLETKTLLDKRPEFLEGRIKSYINKFGKTFDVSKSDFIKLMIKAEKQKSCSELHTSSVEKEK